MVTLPPVMSCRLNRETVARKKEVWKVRDQTKKGMGFVGIILLLGECHPPHLSGLGMDMDLKILACYDWE